MRCAGPALAAAGLIKRTCPAYSAVEHVVVQRSAVAGPSRCAAGLRWWQRCGGDARCASWLGSRLRGATRACVHGRGTFHVHVFMHEFKLTYTIILMPWPFAMAMRHLPVSHVPRSVQGKGPSLPGSVAAVLLRFEGSGASHACAHASPCVASCSGMY